MSRETQLEHPPSPPKVKILWCQLCDVNSAVNCCTEGDAQTQNKKILSLTWCQWIYVCCVVIISTTSSSSSSHWPASVSQSNAHIRAVMFHTLHRSLTNTRLYPYLVTLCQPFCIISKVLFTTWTDVLPQLPPSNVSVSNPFIKRIVRTLPHRPCPSAPLYPSFSAPPALLGSEVARHCRRQWTFTDHQPPTDSIQCLAGRSQLCRTGRPGAWVIAPPTVPLVVLGCWGRSGGCPCRRRIPHDDPGPESSWCLDSSFFYPPPPPSPVSRTTAHVPTTSLRTEGCFYVTPMPQLPDCLESARTA